MDIGKRVRDAREARGMTQEELARRAGVPLNRVGRIETGTVTDPHYSTLSRIAGGLDVSVGELLQEPVPLVEAPEVGPEPLARYDPETWRRRLAYYRGVLEIHLQGWEEAAATLRTHKVPFHEGWARTVRQAAADDWNWLKENDLPEDLKTLLEVAEAGDELPQPVREEAARLTRALERLGEIPRLVTEAEREALRDRSEGEPGNVTNLLEEREKKGREGIPPGDVLSKAFENHREIS